MSERSYVVHAKWDAEAKVWTATSEDVPGLVTEADTWDEMVNKALGMIFELLEDNDALPDQGPIAVAFTTIEVTLLAY